MTIKTTPRSTPLLSSSEREVLGALEKLPSSYEVLVSPNGLPGQNETTPSWYEPDFVVTAPDGKRVIIDVKSSHSLSLSNMAKLAKVSRYAEAQGDRFIVLVFSASKPPPQRLEGLEQLQVSYVADPSEVREKVLEALNTPPARHSED